MQNLQLPALPSGIYPGDYIRADLIGEVCLNSRIAPSQIAPDARIERVTSPPTRSDCEKHETGWVHLDARSRTLPEGIRETGAPVKLNVICRVAQGKGADGKPIFTAEPVAIGDTAIHRLSDDESRRYTYERGQQFAALDDFGKRAAAKVRWQNHLVRPLSDKQFMGGDEYRKGMAQPPTGKLTLPLGKYGAEAVARVAQSSNRRGGLPNQE